MDGVGGSDDKGSACNEGDPSSNPGSGKFPGKGNDNSFQYSCPENSVNGGASWAIMHEVAKSQTQLNVSCFCLTAKSQSRLTILLSVGS